MKTLRAVLYARVSTDTGEQDPESQLQALRPWVASRGWSQVGEYSDHVSGDPKRRRGDPPGLAGALRVLAERRAEVLVVFSACRLVRSPVQLVQLVERIESYGAKVASLQDGADLDTTTDAGELFLFFRGWMARMEIRLRSARTKAGQARGRAAGRFPGRPRRAVDLVRVEELRQLGKSWEEVGKVLEVGAETARRAWQESRGPRPKNPPAEVEDPPVETGPNLEAPQ